MCEKELICWWSNQVCPIWTLWEKSRIRSVTRWVGMNDCQYPHWLIFSFLPPLSPVPQSPPVGVQRFRGVCHVVAWSTARRLWPAGCCNGGHDRLPPSRWGSDRQNRDCALTEFQKCVFVSLFGPASTLTPRLKAKWITVKTVVFFRLWRQLMHRVVKWKRIK